MTKINNTITMKEPDEPKEDPDPFQLLDPFSRLSPILQIFYQIMSKDPPPQIIQQMKMEMKNSGESMSYLQM